MQDRHRDAVSLPRVEIGRKQLVVEVRSVGIGVVIGEGPVPVPSPRVVVDVVSVICDAVRCGGKSIDFDSHFVTVDFRRYDAVKGELRCFIVQLGFGR